MSKEPAFDWRNLLTVQSTVVHDIPRDYGTPEEYVVRFEAINHLVPTRKRVWDFMMVRGRTKRPRKRRTAA